MTKRLKTWYLYVLLCVDRSLYTGITTDLKRRFDEHLYDKKGAKYTRSRKPLRILYTEKYFGRSKASIREAQIKKMTRAQKELLVLKKSLPTVRSSKKIDAT